MVWLSLSSCPALRALAAESLAAAGRRNSGGQSSKSPAATEDLGPTRFQVTTSPPHHDNADLVSYLPSRSSPVRSLSPAASPARCLSLQPFFSRSPRPVRFNQQPLGRRSFSARATMAFFLPSLRASTSASSSSTAVACCSTAPFSRRTVVHHPRLPNPPKYRPKLHPASFSEAMPESSPGAGDGGATFEYNPAPSAKAPRTVASGVDGLLAPNLSPNGRRMPAAWRKVPGWGYMAPRIDRLVDGSEAARQAGWRPEKPSAAVVAEMNKLRQEDPVTNSNNKLAKQCVLHEALAVLVDELKSYGPWTDHPLFYAVPYFAAVDFLANHRFGIHPQIVAKYAPPPVAYKLQRALDTSAAIERIPTKRLIKLEARQIRKAQQP